MFVGTNELYLNEGTVKLAIQAWLDEHLAVKTKKPEVVSVRQSPGSATGCPEFVVKIRERVTEGMT